MELAEELNNRVDLVESFKLEIQNKLGDDGDEALIEYVMVLLATAKNREPGEIESDLDAFLGERTIEFVQGWLLKRFKEFQNIAFEGVQKSSLSVIGSPPPVEQKKIPVPQSPGAMAQMPSNQYSPTPTANNNGYDMSFNNNNGQGMRRYMPSSPNNNFNGYNNYNNNMNNYNNYSNYNNMRNNGRMRYNRNNYNQNQYNQNNQYGNQNNQFHQGLRYNNANYANNNGHNSYYRGSPGGGMAGYQNYNNNNYNNNSYYGNPQSNPNFIPISPNVDRTSQLPATSTNVAASSSSDKLLLPGEMAMLEAAKDKTSQKKDDSSLKVTVSFNDNNNPEVMSPVPNPNSYQSGPPPVMPQVLQNANAPLNSVVDNSAVALQQLASANPAYAAAVAAAAAALTNPMSLTKLMPMFNQGSVNASSTSTVLCKYWPNCHFGNQCLYLHPSPSSNSSVSKNMIDCRFYPNCKNIKCPYKHGPSLIPCKYGKDCANPVICPFKHERIVTEQETSAVKQEAKEVSIKRPDEICEESKVVKEEEKQALEKAQVTDKGFDEQEVKSAEIVKEGTGIVSMDVKEKESNDPNDEKDVEVVVKEQKLVLEETNKAAIEVPNQVSVKVEESQIANKNSAKAIGDLINRFEKLASTKPLEKEEEKSDAE